MSATDLIVVLGALLGVAIALAGIAQLDPRVRERLGRGQVTAKRTSAVAAGAVLIGAVLVMLALGGFE